MRIQQTMFATLLAGFSALSAAQTFECILKDGENTRNMSLVIDTRSSTVNDKAREAFSATKQSIRWKTRLGVQDKDGKHYPAWSESTLDLTAGSLTNRIFADKNGATPELVGTTSGQCKKLK